MTFAVNFVIIHYMKNNKWTDEQVRELKKLYGKHTAAECAKHFNKTVSAIHSKVHYLRKRGWTFDRKRDIKVRKTTPPHAITSIHKDKTKIIPRKNKYNT